MSTTTTGLFPPNCGLCGKTDDLLRCSRCKVTMYCSREHQAADRPSHKSDCNYVDKMRNMLTTEETKLRSHPAKFFEKDAGRFWGIWETRGYMTARQGFVDALSSICTYDSVQTQVDHLMDMLRLSRSDNMGVRDQVPALLLRLHKDQECYDFIKWWGTIANERDYDWGKGADMYLNIKNADAISEPVEYLRHNLPALNHMVAMTLLKTKLLLDLIAMAAEADFVTVRDKVPREIFVCTARPPPVTPVSPIMAGHRAKILENKDHYWVSIYEKLAPQVDMLYEMVDKANKHFWPALLDPVEQEIEQPNRFMMGSVEEMKLAIRYWHYAWVETPDAMVVIAFKTKGVRVYKG